MDIPAILLDRLEMARMIGQGHFGTVYRGFDRKLGIEVAVKELHGPGPLFRQEAEILHRMNHPNLVRLLEVFSDAKTGTHYLVEEIIDGVGLEKFFLEADWADRWETTVQVLRGLEYLHQRGIVHMDIKPSNILVADSPPPRATEGTGPCDVAAPRTARHGTWPSSSPVAPFAPLRGRRDEETLGPCVEGEEKKDFPSGQAGKGKKDLPSPLAGEGLGGGGRLVAKILDFGIAERIGPRGGEGSFSGTFPYVAPEVIRGEMVDGRADLFSLGMVLFECAAGRGERPPNGTVDENIREAIARRPPTVDEFPPGAPEPFREMICALLQPDASKRFHSANHAIRFVNRALGSRFQLEPGRLRLPDHSAALMAGRSRALEDLQSCHEKFMEAVARNLTVAVLGAPDHGKTPLLQEFLHWAQMNDHDAIALLGLGDRLGAVFKTLISPRAREIPSSLAPFLKRILPDAFADAPDAEPLSTDPGLEKKRLYEKLAEAFDGLLGDRRIIVLIDDLHLKPDVAEFLSYYVRPYVANRPPGGSSAGQQIFLVLSARTAQELPRDLRVDRLMELTPWGQADLRKILPSLLAVETVPEPLVLAVWDQSGGHPGRAVEYARRVAETLLRAGEDVEAQLKTLSEADLKGLRTASESYQDQYTTLPDSERRIMQWLAVAPRDLSPEELADLDPTLRVGCRLALRQLQSGGWVGDIGARFRIAGPDRLEFLRGTLGPETRHSLQLQVSEVMREAWRESALDRAAEMIRGGEVEAGFAAARPEIETTIELHQPTRVLQFLEAHFESSHRLPAGVRQVFHRLMGEACIMSGNYRRAIEVLEGYDHPLLFARACRYAGRLEEARQAADKAKTSTLEPHTRIAADALLADVSMEQGRYQEAEALAEPYLTDSGGWATEDRVTFRHIKAKAHFYRGEYDQAALLFKQNCTETEQPGGRMSQRALALNSLAAAYLAQGKVDECLPYLHSSAEIAQQIGDIRTLGLAHVNLGLACAEKGRPDEAGGHYDLAMTTFRKIGDRSNEARTAYNRGVLAVQMGDEVQAEDRFADALDLARSLNMGHLEATIRLQRAEISRQKGAADRAMADCDRAEELARAEGLRQEVFLARLKKLEIRMAREEVERVLADLEICEQDMRGLSYTEQEAWALFLRGCLMEKSDPAGAARAWEKATLKWNEAGTADPALRRKIDAHLAGLKGSSGERVISSAPVGEVRSGADLMSVLNLVERMNLAVDVTEVLTGIVDSMVRFADAERGFLLLKEDGRLEVKVARARDASDLMGSDHRFSLTVAAEALERGEPVITFDASQDPRFQESVSIYHLQLRSIMCVPLRVRGEPLGALYLDNRAGAGHFGDRHVPILVALGNLAAAAIHKAQLIGSSIRDQKELRRAVRELKESKQKAELLSAELASANERLQGVVAEQERQIEASEHRLGLLLDQERPKYQYDRLIGSSRVWRQILRLADRAVESRVPVLLLGESGTGKELIARAIHFQSSRKAKAFIPVNCAALPDDLFESELFGHARGAFTGADRDKPGLFEAAHGGTFFLDEIGEIPTGIQAKFLRVLQDGVVRRLGSNSETPVDVRVIAATNRNLEQSIREGKFREDLFYRLSVFEIALPPLRERIEDLPELVDHFLKQIAAEEQKPAKTVDPSCMRRLRSYAWPGNIRELENAVRRAFIITPGKLVDIRLLDRGKGSPPGKEEQEPDEPLPLQEALDQTRRKHLAAALRRNSGNVSATARELKVDRTHLAFLIRKLGLDRPRRPQH